MKNNTGFSLIELSIVLIIIGLLVVGIIKGAGLIKSSKALGVTNELTRYVTATEMFVGKYNELPGIMPDPKKYFGDKAHTSTITNNSFINTSGDPTNVESLNFFNHLSLSGFLDDEFYQGSDTDLDSVSSITKKYYPFSKSSKSNFFYVRGDEVDNNYNQINRIGISSRTSAEGLDADFVYMVDIKIDDGDPLSGYISIVPTPLLKENTEATN